MTLGGRVALRCPAMTDYKVGGTAMPSNARILTGLPKHVGAICPGPRSRSGTAPGENCLRPLGP